MKENEKKKKKKDLAGNLQQLQVSPMSIKHGIAEHCSRVSASGNTFRNIEQPCTVSSFFYKRVISEVS